MEGPHHSVNSVEIRAGTLAWCHFWPLAGIEKRGAKMSEIATKLPHMRPHLG